MKADNLAKLRSDRVWLAADSCRIEDFAALVERTTNPADYPFASEVHKNVPIYEGAAIRALVPTPTSARRCWPNGSRR